MVANLKDPTYTIWIKYFRKNNTEKFANHSIRFKVLQLSSLERAPSNSHGREGYYRNNAGEKTIVYQVGAKR
ncbi:hypothetical protein LPYR103PRE_06510 [Segatella asaccharophila]